MANSRHIIGRQIIEIELPASGGNNLQLSEHISRLANGPVLHAIERALDGIDRHDQTLRLDRLEVNVDCTDISLLEQAIRQQLEQAIAQQLERQLMPAFQPGADKPAEVIPVAQSDGEIILYFLQHGYLPWFAPAGLTLAELEYRFSETLAQEASFVRQLVRLLQRPFVLERLLRQFSADMPWRILAAQHAWPDVQTQQDIRFFLQGQDTTTQCALWASMYARPEAIIALFQQQKGPVTKKDLYQIIPTSVQEQPKTGTAATDGIYLQNAGLILLHPFIAGLFDALQLRTGKQINDPFEAVFALHFAATGQTKAAEWELILPKILCGIALDAPFPNELNLSETVQQEVEHLLQTVIEHWGALRNTSPQGLREGFLQRDGKLLQQGDGWLLRVEQKGQDILLDQLPWGMGMVKLPWMPGMLVTEWS